MKFKQAVLACSVAAAMAALSGTATASEHLFMADATLNMNGPPALSAAQTLGRGALIGTSSNKVDIMSVQYTRRF